MGQRRPCDPQHVQITRALKSPTLGGAADQGLGSSSRSFIPEITRSKALVQRSITQVGGFGMVSYGWRDVLAVLISAMGQMLWRFHKRVFLVKQLNSILQLICETF